MIVYLIKADTLPSTCTPLFDQAAQPTLFYKGLMFPSAVGLHYVIPTPAINCPHNRKDWTSLRFQMQRFCGWRSSNSYELYTLRCYILVGSLNIGLQWYRRHCQYWGWYSHLSECVRSSLLRWITESYHLGLLWTPWKFPLEREYLILTISHS